MSFYGLPLSNVNSNAFYGLPLSNVNSNAVAAAVAAADSDDDELPFERDDWIPRTSSGKQKTPNQIRGALQRYIDSSNETQTSIINQLGVNNNSFRKFMNPGTYKKQWSAVQNGTYWAAARFLERKKHEAKTTSGKKRKSTGDEGNAAKKSASSTSRMEAELLMARINQVELPANAPVYDSCPELVKKIKDYLKEDGVTKAAFCRALGDLNSNSLNPFLMGKKQDQCGTVAYPRAYRFFERKRLLEKKPKTARRVKNEAEHPNGFRLIKERPSRVLYVVPRGNFMY